MAKTIKHRVSRLLFCLIAVGVLLITNENGMLSETLSQMVTSESTTITIANNNSQRARVIVDEELEQSLWNADDGHDVNEDHADQDNDITTLERKYGSWHEWFDPLYTWDPTVATQYSSGAASSAHNNHTNDVHQVLFYHVMKAGGSSLYRTFYRMSLKYDQDVDQCGWTGDCCGVETPGKLAIFNHWKKKKMGSQKKLLAMAFREPIERTISHYFQVKPCPDGTGGGSDRGCTRVARNGILPFLEKCHFARNYQIKYLDHDYQNLRQVDVILRSDRIEESLALMSIQYHIPIMDLVYIRDKVRLSGDEVQSDKRNKKPTHRRQLQHRKQKIQQLQELQQRTKSNIDQVRTRKKSLSSIQRARPMQNNGKDQKSCTLQWMEELLSPQDLQSLQNCSIACAGLMGQLALQSDELETVKKANSRDLILWKDYVIPRYEHDRSIILQQYNVTQDELDQLVGLYKTVQKDYEKYAPPLARMTKRKGTKKGKTCDQLAVELGLKDARTKKQTNPAAVETSLSKRKKVGGRMGPKEQGKNGLQESGFQERAFQDRKYQVQSLQLERYMTRLAKLENDRERYMRLLNSQEKFDQAVADLKRKIDNTQNILNREKEERENI